MITRVDLADDAVLRQAHEVSIRSAEVGRPWFEASPYDEWAADLRHEDPAERQELWAAYDEGRVVGIAELWLSDDDNTDLLWSDLQVDPEWRGRGHGTALVETLRERAVAERRTQVLIEVNAPGQDYAEHPDFRFAAARGFELGWVENSRHLPLPVADEVLDRYAAASAAAATVYDVHLSRGQVPGDYLAGLCALHNLVNVDAPTGAIDFEPETMTPERLRAYDDLLTRQGRIRLTALAVHRSTGTVAACSELIVPPAPSTQVWQGVTYVHREHRGHRLGMATKVANLRQLQADFPGRSLVRTSNAETNGYMVSINEDLGFQLVEKSVVLRLTVEGAR